MEPKNEGLKDDSPFQPGDFQGSMLIFQAISQNLKKNMLGSRNSGEIFHSATTFLDGWSTKNSFP